MSRSSSALSRGRTSEASSSCCTILLIPTVPWSRTISQSSVSLCRPLCRSRKTLAMISGHVHSYERFTRAEKTFLVTGAAEHGAKSTRTGGVATSTMASMGLPAAFHFLSSRRCQRGLRSRCEVSSSAMGSLRRWTTSPYPGRQALSRGDSELPARTPPPASDCVGQAACSWSQRRCVEPGWIKIGTAPCLPRQGGRKRLPLKLL